MQKKSNELIITRKHTTKVLLGIIGLLLLLTMFVKANRLGNLLSCAFIYLFGNFAIIPVIFIAILCVSLFFDKKKSGAFKTILITLFIGYIFLTMTLLNNNNPSSLETTKLNNIFPHFKALFNGSNGITKPNPFSIYASFTEYGKSLSGGIIAWVLFYFFAEISSLEIAEVIGFVIVGICVLILALTVIRLVKKYHKPREKKAKPIKQETVQVESDVKKFSFGEFENPNKPVIEHPHLQEIIEEEPKEQKVDKTLQSFNVFEDDLLSGKPLNPLIDDIEGGDAFDVFEDSLFDSQEQQEIKVDNEVRDISDSIYTSHQSLQQNLYTKSQSIVSNVDESFNEYQEEDIPEETENNQEYYDEYQEEDIPEEVIDDIASNQEEISNVYEIPEEEENIVDEEIIEESVEEVKEVVPEVKKPTINKNYKLPPMNLLDNPRSIDNTENIQEANVKAVRLNAKLQSLGIRAKVKDFIVAPSFTRFQIEVENNVKINVFSSVKNDIMMALSAQTITILTPIPGTSYVGIDIPNVKRSMVTFKECLAALPFDKQDEKLLMVAGKDILNNVVSFKLNDTPHLLVAGATGGGKSAGLNGYIMSILMRCKPSEVKLVLVDPKQVEFTPYHDIPHLLCPVITDSKEASVALRKITEEIHRRNAIFKDAQAKNIEAYNRIMKENGKEEMPYIVVIVDELANLMIAAKAVVEDSIAVITSLARSTGIHLVVATQHPSVDVITGVIKSNIPSRVAFTVATNIDSRVILDDGGAEALLGKGDMLLKLNGKFTTDRVQGCFITDDEISRVADYVRGQQEVIFNEEFLDLQEKQEQQQFEEIDATGLSKDDELYEKVLFYLTMNTICSVSSLRRHFSLGQPKAGRIIDMLTEDGYISQPDGNKPRTVNQEAIRAHFRAEEE